MSIPLRFILVKLLIGEGRAVAFFLFAACGGEKRKRSEDTSRSAKGQPPLGTLLLSDLATALRGGQIKKQTRRS
jgi:hypothetical protein